MQAIDLTTVPVGPTEFGEWAALDAPLGLGAFGVNVAVAGSEEERSRAARRGREHAGGALRRHLGTRALRRRRRDIDAGPGTAVGVGEPALKRGFRALEPGARVLCIGAQPPNRPARWGYWISGGEP